MAGRRTSPPGMGHQVEDGKGRTSEACTRGKGLRDFMVHAFRSGQILA